MRLPNTASIARAALAAFLVLLALAAIARAAGARTIAWHRAGASTFGGVCEPREWRGYRGADLHVLWHSIAELGMGTYMGNLPNKTRLRLLLPATHRGMTVYKRDIGLGGGAVYDPVMRLARRRDIDVYSPVLTQLLGHTSCTWTGIVLWRRT